MNVTEVILGVVNLVQVVALAWIGYRLQLAQLSVRRLNGDVSKLRALAQQVQPASGPPETSGGPQNASQASSSTSQP